MKIYRWVKEEEVPLPCLVARGCPAQVNLEPKTWDLKDGFSYWIWLICGGWSIVRFARCDHAKTCTNSCNSFFVDDSMF